MPPNCAYRAAVGQLPLGFVREQSAARRTARERSDGPAPDAGGDPEVAREAGRDPNGSPEGAPDDRPERAAAAGPPADAPPASGARPPRAVAPPTGERPGRDAAPDAPPRTPRSDRRTVYAVGELCGMLGRTLQEHHPSFWVTGEISGLRVHGGSGHAYFDLKDGSGKMPCVVWNSNRPRIRFEPKDGTQVLCHAKTALYPKSGRLQLSVFFMEPAGMGALFAEFEARRERLRAEGLTDPANKRPLPTFPGTVGVVTSRSGAALHDVLRALWHRHPGLRVILAAAPVQGRAAAPRIRAALRRLDALGACDAILVVRGGGSLEDLWAFNEEVVARAIAECRTPVVTGVGHETDTTIADLVADRRASTPTAAAQAVAPVRADWLERIERAEHRLRRAGASHVSERRHQLRALERQLRHPAERHRALRAELATLTHRLETARARHLERAGRRLRALEQRVAAQHPRVRLERGRARVQRLEDRMDRAASSATIDARHRLIALAGRLESSSPLAVLARGYAFATKADGRVVRASDDVQIGEPVHVRLARGAFDATVTHVLPSETDDD